MSFREYLNQRAVTNTPAGDFTKDARRDPNMPDAKSWSELREYLLKVARVDGVIPADYQVWRGYQRRLRNF
jgi:hypothetical protein